MFLKNWPIFLLKSSFFSMFAGRVFETAALNYVVLGISFKKSPQYSLIPKKDFLLIMDTSKNKIQCRTNLGNPTLTMPFLGRS